MKTQQDTRVRMVALENLRAMCAHVSGRCRVYKVEKVTRSRVHVSYSNPDEYGNARPIVAILPCYPSGFSADEPTKDHWEDDKFVRAGDAGNPRVVLDPLRFVGDDGTGADQAFDVLWDCAPMWRRTTLGQDLWTASPASDVVSAIDHLHDRLRAHFGDDYGYSALGRGVVLGRCNVGDVVVARDRHAIIEDAIRDSAADRRARAVAHEQPSAPKGGDHGGDAR